MAALEDPGVQCAVSCAGGENLGRQRISNVDSYGNKLVICCLFMARRESSVRDGALGSRQCEGASIPC